MNTLHFRQAAGLLTLLGVGACADPITDVQIDDWEPAVALPLLETSFTLRDALADTDFTEYIEEREGGALHIGLAEELFDVNVGERVPLIPLVFPMTAPETALDFAQLASSLPVSRLHVSGNRAIVQLRNDYNVAATATVTSGNFDLDGGGLRRTLVIPAGQTVADTFAVDAAAFVVGDDGMVRLSYAADLADGRTDVQLTGGFFRLEPGRFEYAEGGLSNVAFSLELDSLQLSFFDALEPGTISLVDPRAKLVIDNSVGAPVRLSSPGSYFGYRDGETAEIISPLTAGLDFAYPALGEGPVFKRSELSFGSDVSNFVELLSGLPSVIDFNLHCDVNAAELPERFSIHRTSSVRGAIELDVPLALEFNGFTLEQEFDISGESFEGAADVELLARITNGFGLGVKLQATFLDAGGRELLTAFPAPVEVLEAAVVDARGRTTATTETEVRIEIARSDIAAIARAAAVRLKVILDSPDGAGGSADYTQLYYDNAVAVRLGALITLDAGEALAR